MEEEASPPGEADIATIRNSLLNDPAEKAMAEAKAPVYDDLPMVHRSDWRAKQPWDGGKDVNERLKIPVMYVVLNHSGGEACKTQEDCEGEMRAMQIKDFQERRLNDIQYNWMIGGDGKIYEGRGWHWRPPLNPEVPEHFDHSVEILFSGNYIDEPVPYEMSDPCFDLIQVLRARGVIHRFFKFERLVKFKRHNRDPGQLKDELPP